MAWLVQNRGWLMVEPGLKAGHHTQAEAARCAKPSQETTASTSWLCLRNLFPMLEMLLGPIEPGTGGSSWAPYSGSSKQCLLNPWMLRAIQQRCHKSQQFKDRWGAYLPEMQLSRDAACGEAGQWPSSSDTNIFNNDKIEPRYEREERGL